MGGAPTIVNIRPGVGFAPDAAASFRRAERDWGRQIGCNSTYRDYGLQLSMWQAWEAWTQGRGPKPNHSRPARPEDSKHVMGLALDTSDISIPGFLAHMADHGWIQILPDDPTERHHLEYQWWRDNHRNDPTPAGEEEDDMFTEDDRKVLDAVKSALLNGRKDTGGAERPIDTIVVGIRKLDDLLRVPEQQFGWPQHTYNLLVAVSLAIGQGAGGAPVDVPALAKAVRDGLGADVAAELAKRLAS